MDTRIAAHSFLPFNHGHGIGTHEKSLETGLNTGPLVYPNPANTTISIEPHENHRKSSVVSIEIVSMLGELIYTWSGLYTSEIRLSVQDYAKGTYLERSRWGNGPCRTAPFCLGGW
ncbi:MAG: T9SS type A sorting domain-containing protein [Ignavibacteria bacterium]|nr:T9SS type A sorting domain-containing protein [Ignavibacteria bacterium]